MISSPNMQRLLAAVSLALVLSSAAPANARDSIEKQITLLKQSDDFRVRTQAALALGASRDKRAVVPLCHALDDGNRTVRIASASALGRLRLGGKGCLERRLAVESQDAVKSSIQRALATVGGGDGGGAEPAIGSSTKYYVALAKVANAPNPEVAALVRANMVQVARGLSEYAIAPESETLAQAKALLAKHPGIKAFYLAPTLSKPEYTGGSLTVRLSVAMLTYPDKVLLGQLPIKLTQEDVAKGDTRAEQALAGLAAERAMQKFAKHAGSLGS